MCVYVFVCVCVYVCMRVYVCVCVCVCREEDAAMATSLPYVVFSMHLLLRLVGHLGSGQFGRVEKGVWDSPFGSKDVAVKTLNPGASENDRVRFLKEAAIMGQFSHPNVVEFHGIVSDGEPVSH